MRYRIIVSALGLGLIASLAFAPSPTRAASPEAALFGSRGDVEQISLSPDGSKIAYMQPTKGRGSALYVVDLEKGGAPKRILISTGDPERLRGCRWSTDVRLVCGIFMIARDGSDAHPFSRLLSVNADGSDPKELSPKTTNRSLGVLQFGGEVIDWGGDGSGSALMVRQYIPETDAMTRMADSRDGVGVELVNTTTLERKLVEKPRVDVREFISDGRGVIRMVSTQPELASGYAAGRINWSYRKQGSRDWTPFGSVAVDSQTVDGFDPVAVDPDLNVVYGLDRLDGRAALFKVSLDGSLKKELVLAHPQVDIDGPLRIGRQRRVVGATYATDRRVAEYFDPELKRLQASLHRALPQSPLIYVLDASADEKRLLIYAGADVDPGRYYLFDKATKKLEELLPVRSNLEGRKLAEVKAITYPAADGAMVPAYLTLPPGSDGKNLPAIVLPHGGPTARDEWGFDWLSQFFAARGYAVLQPNFRGSTGYGETWFKDNGFKSWKLAIGDVTDAGRWMVKAGIAAPGKLAIFGWSYGGYAALQSGVVAPDLFKAIVAVAPVTDLETLRQERRNYADFAIRDAFIGRGPHVKEGSPAQNASRFQAPVLMFQGDLDLNVGIIESRIMKEALVAAGKPVELVEFKGLDHQLVDDAARTQLLDQSDSFIRKALGLN